MPANKGNEKIVYIIFGIIILLAIAVMLYFHFTRKICPAEIKIETVSTDVTTDQPVTFTATISGNNKVVKMNWDFGDGSFKNEDDTIVIHKFATEGKHTVTLRVNKDCFSNSVTINVTKAVVIQEIPRLTPTIIAPQTAYVGIPVKFKDATKDATSWEWYFENSKDILQGSEVTYTFETPGERTVSLVVNGNSNRADFKIKVIVAHVTKGTAPNVTEKDFIKMLVELHDEIRQITDFKPYFCNDLTTKIMVDGKSTDFQSFCKLFMLTDDTRISKLTMKKDPATNCITDMEIERK